MSKNGSILVSAIDPSKRAVTLETNAGIWKENGTKTIAITANSDGDAIAELQSEMVPQTARVRASIANILCVLCALCG